MKKMILILLLLFNYSCANEDYRINLSQLNLLEDSLRERDYSQWEPNIVSQETFDKKTANGYYPIISETREYSETRRIYKKLDRGYFVSRSGANLFYFLKYHTKYTKEGYTLLTLTRYTTRSGDKRYSATWVSNGALEDSLEYLNYYGISQASVRLD